MILLLLLTLVVNQECQRRDVSDEDCPQEEWRGDGYVYRYRCYN